MPALYDIVGSIVFVGLVFLVGRFIYVRAFNKRNEH